jgi:hypothetical protein
MTPIKSDRSDYPEVMRAIGQFIQQESLSEVSLLEFDRGWVVTGLTYKATAQGFIRVPVDFVLSHDDVREMIQTMTKRRRPVEPTKRGWLR